MTRQQKKFKTAAKKCKGNRNYRSCMSKALSGGKMSGYDDYDGFGYPPLEDFGQLVAKGVIPSKAEFMSLIKSGSGAGVAIVGSEVVKNTVVGYFPAAIIPYSDYIWTALKVIGGIAGGKLIYKYSPDIGSGFAIGMFASAAKDVYGYATGAIGAGAAPALSQYDEQTLLLGAGNYDQVDVEEEGRLAQVDIEEGGRLAGIYGYTPSVGTVNVANV